MFNLLCLPSSIVIIVTTVIFALKDVVHQLVHIVQNTHDSAQTLVQSIMKFQENTSSRILLSSELVRRNAKILPFIEDTTQKIHSTLDELINSDQIPFEETTHSGLGP